MSLLSGFGCPGVSVTPQPKLGDILYGETALPQVLCKDNGGESAFRIALANLNGAKIFLPLVGSVICSSQSSNCQGSYSYKVVGFVGIKYLGSKWTNQFSDGSTPTCPIGDPCQENSNWPSACNETRICLYGTFERSVVPGADISLDAGTPDIGALAVQLLP